MLRLLAATLGMTLGLLGTVSAGKHLSIDLLARLISPEFRQADEQFASISRLPPLPRPCSASCPSLGYHSRAAYSPTQLHWVQVDLGESQLLDWVVVVPAIGPAGDSGPGYCFPQQFRIDLAERPDFSDSSTAAEISTDPTTCCQPVLIPLNGRRARFIRVTATRLAGRDGLYFFALGELLAISGNRNLAAGRTVSALDSIENPPVWGMQYLVDGQSMIGPPLGPGPSPGDGYHSAISATPNEHKWVQVDLGDSCPLMEVRLVPARSSDVADRRGFGFPVRFKVEVACSADFYSPHLLFDSTTADYPNPGDGLVVIPANGVRARFVRVTATRLWERTGDFVFALAELQVYSDCQNIAHNSPVTALDSIEQGLWSRRYLVDGCSSRNQILDWPEWISFQRQWTDWQVSQREARLAWEAARASATDNLLRLTIACVLSFITLISGFLWRRRVVHWRETEKVRERISRDLHDEVGSKLGSILLLAQSGESKDLPEVQRIADEAAAAMRDAIWLLGGEADTLADVFGKIRESSARLLIGHDYRFELRDTETTERVSLEFKRQFFLMVKEVFHNIARHAHAREVAIREYRDGGWLILEVQDDGVGFDPEPPNSGVGLASLRERAARLRGEVIIHTSPGKGTMVRLVVRISP